MPRRDSRVDEIPKAGKTADLPREQSTECEIVIKLNPPEALGPQIPQSVHLRLEEVAQ